MNKPELTAISVLDTFTLSGIGVIQVKIILDDNSEESDIDDIESYLELLGRKIKRLKKAFKPAIDSTN